MPTVPDLWIVTMQVVSLDRVGGVLLCGEAKESGARAPLSVYGGRLRRRRITDPPTPHE
jgi:hypothetical protein